MKSINSLLIGSFCLVAFLQLQNVDGGLISTYESSSSSNILNLTVISAKLKPIPKDTLWNVRVYGLDTSKALKLPINSTETNGIVHVDYATLYVESNDSPSWNQSFQFSSDLFNEQSYIALEVNYAMFNFQVFYTGGTEFTIAQLRKFPKTVQLIMSDQTGDSPGTITISWQ